MKKKVIKPFELEKAKNGAKVETKEGFPVDILCFDANLVESFQIVGIVNAIYGDSEDSVVKRFIMTWLPDGTYCEHGSGKADLVLVEEQEVPSVTKEEVKEHLQWFVDNADHMIEGFGAKVYEKLLGMVVAMRIAYRNRDNGIIPDLVKEKVQPTTREAEPTTNDAQDAKQEDVNYCALKLEGIEEIPNEEFAKSYVKFAVSCVNDALGYSAKKRNAFGWQKVWDNQGYFGVIEQENAKNIIEKYPEFPFRICTTKVKASDDNGKA